LAFYFHLITAAAAAVATVAVALIGLFCVNNDYWFLWLFDYAMMHRKKRVGEESLGVAFFFIFFTLFLHRLFGEVLNILLELMACQSVRQLNCRTDIVGLF